MSQETSSPNPADRDTSLLGPAGVGGDPFPGEYRLVRRLDGGAFGEVWLADDLSPLGWQVALKFLRPDRARLALAQTTLANEARTLAALRHPNIVQVLAWKTVPVTGLPCLVMQYVAGGSLEARVKRQGPLPWHLAGRYVADVADGLLLVHRKGIIHRDVKPANLLWAPDEDEALLADFGIAARLADVRTIAGTGRFMAPEAFAGDTSPALDVYSLTASLFWLLTGEAPFAGHDIDTLLAAIHTGLPPRDGRLAGVPAPLEELLRAGLQAAPGRRIALEDFAGELRGALNHLLADSLPSPGAGPAVQLLVSRQVGPRFEPLADSSLAPGLSRDPARVPAAPARVCAHTGERIRIEARAGEAGYLTVFNVGPTGNLNLLCPAEPGQPPPRVAAGEPLPLLDVELTPPTGRERVFAVWTRGPWPLRLDELRSLADGRAYGATRDMVRVRQSLQAVPSHERQVVVLELEHVE